MSLTHLSQWIIDNSGRSIKRFVLEATNSISKVLVVPWCDAGGVTSYAAGCAIIEKVERASPELNSTGRAPW
jgi:hypothetical protein